MSVLENIKSLKTNKVRLLICIITFCLAISHLYQLIVSDNQICLLRIGIYIIGCFGVLLFGNKALFAILILTSLIASYFNSFINFNSFFVILLSCRLYRKTEKYLLIIYAINEILALIVQEKEITHLIIHFLTCSLFYLVYFYVNTPALKLTSDEIKILQELKQKKMLKCCDSFSKNILTQKLKTARERNEIDTTAELLAMFSMHKIVKIDTKSDTKSDTKI